MRDFFKIYSLDFSIEMHIISFTRIINSEEINSVQKIRI